MATPHNRGTSNRSDTKLGKPNMPANPPARSQGLTTVEQAILRALKQHSRQMDELLDTLRQYSSAAVKAAVWQLIDRGQVELRPDRSLKRAA